MLKSLRLKNCFTHKDVTFNFNEGFTAITGPNGSGKSLLPEMIKYAYFGTSALRGIAEDYKDLEVEHEFFINGKPYEVHRSANKATLFRGHKTGDKIAVGTKPVNQAITELFGYSKAVFEVANSVEQKKVDEFCGMLPTARKKLVDETIGLSALDALTKWIAEKETHLRATLSARSDLLVPPQEPAKNDKYLPALDLKLHLENLRFTKAQRDAAARQAAVVVEFPEVDVLAEDDDKYDEYVAQEKLYQTLATEAVINHRETEKVPAVVGEYVEAKLEEDDAKLEEYASKQAELQVIKAKRETLAGLHDAIHEPVYTDKELEEAEKVHAEIKRWEERKKLRANDVPYHCENCNHDGHMHDPRLSEYADVPEERPATPELSFLQIANERTLIAGLPRKNELERQVFECDEYLSVNPDFFDRIRAINAARKAVADNAEKKRNMDRRAELLAERLEIGKKLTDNPSRKADVDRISDKRKGVSDYNIHLAHAKKQQEAVDASKVLLAKFDKTLDEDLIQLEERHTAAVVYEANMVTFRAAKVAYDAEIELQTRLVAEQEDWQKGKLAIADLRTKIKGYLLPSLNKVASYLLNEFTGGELSWVVVNEDFEVIVEGKRVETLSGAGKTVANLALRIGLGQVLTNKVFPVLLLDEADESCDDERAGFIERMLQVLKKDVKQIVSITHKTGTLADHHIRL